MRLLRFRVRAFFALAAVLLPLPAAGQAPKYPNFPSESPSKLEEKREGWHYERRVVEIPMRDGVKLHTVILVPRGAKGAPILMTRTPYEADKLTANTESSHLGPSLQGYDNAV